MIWLWLMIRSRGMMNNWGMMDNGMVNRGSMVHYRSSMVDWTSMVNKCSRVSSWCRVDRLRLMIWFRGGMINGGGVIYGLYWAISWGGGVTVNWGIRMDCGHCYRGKYL